MHRSDSIKTTTVAALTLAGLTFAASPTRATAAPISVPGTILGSVSTRSTNVVNPNAAYSNITNFVSEAVIQGGDTEINGVNYTNFLADDLNPTNNGPVQSITFSVYNATAAAITAQPVIDFFASDGAGGAPGTYLGAFNAAADGGLFSLPPAVSLLQFTFGGTFNFPSGTLWAGEYFTNSGAPDTTATQLASLGQGLFNPPNVGTSLDQQYFQSSTGAPFDASNPAGGAVQASPYSGNPVANFGWEIVTPEPTSLAILAALPLLAAARRRASA